MLRSLKKRYLFLVLSSSVLSVLVSYMCFSPKSSLDGNHYTAVAPPVSKHRLAPERCLLSTSGGSRGAQLVLDSLRRPSMHGWKRTRWVLLGVLHAPHSRCFAQVRLEDGTVVDNWWLTLQSSWWV